MKTHHFLHLRVLFCVIACFSTYPLFADAENPIPSIRINIDAPDQPATVKLSVLNGSIEVRSHTLNELHVTGGKAGITAKSKNGIITLGTSNPNPGKVSILVPSATSLILNCTNGSGIDVDGVSGDLELNSVNASVIVRNATGSVIAHSVQGRVSVEMTRLPADKPLSLSSLNGDIDLTLPPDAPASFRLQTTNGSIHSEFPITVAPTGRFPIGRTVSGTINGEGGPELRLKSLNGSVYLRKAPPITKAEAEASGNSPNQS